MSDWIHTRRGVRFVEHTLPEMIKALNRHSDLLEKMIEKMEQITQDTDHRCEQ